MRKSVSRRDALRAAVVVLPAALAVARVKPAGAATFLRAARRAGALDLAAGTPVARCSIVAVGPVEKGGVTVHMRDAQGRDFLADVLRHDPKAPAIARAGSLAVYLANGGKGTKATKEDHGLAAMALATLIASREAAGMSVPKLSTHSEREPLLFSTSE